ncbi:hypothetical protein RB195_023794 [Necator americanus]|uniref:Neurotransmitter-gated ion-channel ligand-binding domain-containing protein n=2 Tax=Necator americanus TaxID=51031 RepID=A0ABR1EKT1_NECAM
MKDAVSPWQIHGFSVLVFYVVESNRYAEQLYEDLLYYYNKNVRPVKNASESIKVKFGASLIRIIDVDEVNQVLTTNLWLEMQWFDYKLSWDPIRWGGIRKLHIPSDQIWIPDILLYNKYLDGPSSLDVRAPASLSLVSFPRRCHPRRSQVS